MKSKSLRPRLWFIRCAWGLVVAIGLVAAAQAKLVCPPAATPLSAEQAARYRAHAQDRGLLWRITRDGRHSYLYGTMHVGKPEWTGLGPQLRAAIDASDAVALEVDINNRRTLDVMMQYAQRPRFPLPKDLLERMRRQLKFACLTDARLDQLHPSARLHLHQEMMMRLEGLYAEHGAEMQIIDQVRRSGKKKKIHALETVRRQMAAIVVDDPQVAAAEVRAELDRIERQQIRPVLARMAKVWEAGDLEAMEGYAQWCHCINTDADRARLKRLNDDRNPHMAEGIADLHRGGRTIFAAVGAAHMTGPAALPKLLAERGFTVTRIVLR